MPYHVDFPSMPRVPPSRCLNTPLSPRFTSHSNREPHYNLQTPPLRIRVLKSSTLTSNFQPFFVAMDGKGEFACGSSAAANAVVELSLGLSTNGCFGSNPEAKRLKRSSSVSELDAKGGGGSSAQPARASSVPTVTDENHAREMQLRQSSQARRLRMERMRLLRGVRVRAEIPPLQEEGEGASESDQETNGESENGNSGEADPQVPTGDAMNGSPAGQSSAPQGPLSGPGPQGPLPDGAIEGATNVENPEEVVGVPGVNNILIANGRGGSNILVFNNVGAANSTLVTNSVEVGNRAAALNGRNGNGYVVEEEMRKAFLSVPCVTTKAYGPNETKTEGFLYRYESGDDVKIMCICHGRSLTPAEFVKHGGGSDADAAYPLKNINVLRIPSTSSSRVRGL